MLKSIVVSYSVTTAGLVITFQKLLSISLEMSIDNYFLNVTIQDSSQLRLKVTIQHFS